MHQRTNEERPSNAAAQNAMPGGICMVAPPLWHEICTGRVPLLISSQSYIIVVYPLLRSIARTLP